MKRRIMFVSSALIIVNWNLALVCWELSTSLESNHYFLGYGEGGKGEVSVVLWRGGWLGSDTATRRQ